MTWGMRSFIRKRSAGREGSAAARWFCALGPQQPLLLYREPGNPHDANAVRCTDLLGHRVGYVAREHAPVVSARLAAGELLLARTDGPCGCYARDIYIWSEGLEKLARRRALERVGER